MQPAWPQSQNVAVETEEYGACQASTTQGDRVPLRGSAIVLGAHPGVPGSF